MSMERYRARVMRWKDVGPRLACSAGLVVYLTACASIEGTRDASRTTYRSPTVVRVAGVAVLPPPDSAAADDLGPRLGDALAKALEASGVKTTLRAGASHHLMVRAVHLDREQIRAVDVGRSGTVSDANNVWRSRLRFDVELVDARTMAPVWRGVGSAENIDSPRRDVDFGVVVVQQRNPELETFVPEMLEAAAAGVAHQVASLKEQR